MLWGPEQDESRYVPLALLNSSPIRNAYHRLSISNSTDEGTDDAPPLSPITSFPSKDENENKTTSIPTAIEIRAPTDAECGLPPLKEEAWMKIEKPLKPLCEWLINSSYASVVSGYDRATVARAVAHYINLQHTDDQQFARVVLIVVRSDAAAKVWMRELTQVLDDLPINLFGMAAGKRNICYNSLERLTHPGIILTPEKAIKSVNDGISALTKALEKNPFVQTWDMVFSEVLGGGSWLNADYCPFRMVADKRASSAIILNCKDEKKSKAGFTLQAVSNFINVNMTRWKEHEKVPENFWCSAADLKEKKKNEKNTKEIQKQDLQKRVKESKDSMVKQIKNSMNHDKRENVRPEVIQMNISNSPQDAPISKIRTKPVTSCKNAETNYNKTHITLDKNEKESIQEPRIKPRKPSPKKRERSTRDRKKANLVLSINSPDTTQEQTTRNIAVKRPPKDSASAALNDASRKVNNKGKPNFNTNHSNKVDKRANSKITQKSLLPTQFNHDRISSPTTSGEEWVTPTSSIARGSSPENDNEEWFTPRTSLGKDVKQLSEDDGDELKIVVTPIMENSRTNHHDIEKPLDVNQRRSRNKNTSPSHGANVAKSASRNRTQSMPKPLRVLPEPTESNTLNITPILNREQSAQKKQSSTIFASSNRIKLDKLSEKTFERSLEKQPEGSVGRRVPVQPLNTKHTQKGKSNRRRRSVSLNGINDGDSMSKEKIVCPEPSEADLLDKSSTMYRRRSLGSRDNTVKNGFTSNLPSCDDSNTKGAYSKKETSRCLRSNSLGRGMVSIATHEKTSRVPFSSSKRENRGNVSLRSILPGEPNSETPSNIEQSDPLSTNPKASEIRYKDLKCASTGKRTGETQGNKSYSIPPSHETDKESKELSEGKHTSDRRWSMSRLRHEVSSAPPKNTERQVYHNHKSRKESSEHIHHNQPNSGNISISRNRSKEYEFQPDTDNDNESKNLVSLGLRLDDELGLVTNTEKNITTDGARKNYTKGISQRSLPLQKTLDKKRRSSRSMDRSKSSPLVFSEGYFGTPKKQTTMVGERSKEGRTRRRRGSNEHKNQTRAPNITTAPHLEGIVDTSGNNRNASVQLYDDASLSRKLRRSRNVTESSQAPRASDPDEQVILISDDDDGPTFAKNVSSKQLNYHKIPKEKGSKSSRANGSKNGSRQDGNSISPLEQEAIIDFGATPRRQERHRSGTSGRERSSQTYLRNIRKLKPSFAALSRDDQIKYNQNLQKAKDAEKRGRSGHKDALGYYIECADIYDGDEDITGRILSLATSTGSARASDFTRNVPKKKTGNATRKPRGVTKPTKPQRKRRSYEGQISRTPTDQSAHTNEVIVID